MTPNIRFTEITSTSCELAKSYALEDGVAVGSAIAHMTSGVARIRDVSNLSELRAVFDGLDAHQAVTAGVPLVGDSELTTRAAAEFNPDAVARTNETFRYLDTPALFVIDVDTDRDGIYHAPADVLDALEAASPWLRHAHRVARPSASSYVQGRGLRGVHVYLAVTRGTDIPALGLRMQMEQWAKGLGRVIISRSGALLVRQLSDALVFQPSRLLFEARPVLGPGVTRKVPEDAEWLERAADHIGRPARFRNELGWIDVQEIPSLREIETRRFEAAVRQAKNARRAEAKRVALDYHRANALADGREDGDRLGVLALRAMGDKVLPPSWPLVFDFDGDVRRGTVADALRALDAVMGRRCADPFDATRTDLSAADLRSAEVVTVRGTAGIWSHKLTEFFAFGEADAQEISHPLDIAAERLCGTIEEWPDRADKKRSSVSNLMFAIRLLAREAGIALEYDVCTGERHAGDDPPSPAMWLDAVTRLGCTAVAMSNLDTALDAVTQANPIDPWKDAVMTLPAWDKTARLETFFPDLMGAVPTPALAAATSLFFAGLLMRQLRPGAPVPVVMVLIGEQRLGKSHFGRQLCAALNWPAPTELAFTNDERKMSMAAARSPLCELGEMSGLRKRAVEDVKRWTTDTLDVFRIPWGKNEEAHPRRFVLFGTGNKYELHHDETGNSRFLGVPVFATPPEHWTVELPQILAEAKARYCETWGDYEKLVRRASDEVKAHNRAEMEAGNGTVQSDLDDLLPPIILKHVRGRQIDSAVVRNSLDMSPTGRQHHARAVSAWFTTRGWETVKNSRGMRAFRAPQSFEEPTLGDDDESPATVAFLNSFRK